MPVVTSARPDPSRSRPTSMLVSLVLRVIAPLRMAISLPRAALGGVIASRASLGHRGFVDDPRPPGFVGRRDSISKAPMSAGAGRHRPLQGMTEYEYETDKIRCGSKHHARRRLSPGQRPRQLRNRRG